MSYSNGLPPFPSLEEFRNHDVRRMTLTPPEFMTMVMPCISHTIIGWTFQKLDGMYYAACNNDGRYLTSKIVKAQVYEDATVIAVSRGHWGWGRKTEGKWRAVYADA